MRILPAHGGPLDGQGIAFPGTFKIAGDGSVYRFCEDHWEFCGPRSGRCENCGAVAVVSPVDECQHCGGRLILPG